MVYTMGTRANGGGDAVVAHGAVAGAPGGVATMPTANVGSAVPTNESRAGESDIHHHADRHRRDGQRRPGGAHTSKQGEHNSNHTP